MIRSRANRVADSLVGFGMAPRTSVCRTPLVLCRNEAKLTGRAWVSPDRRSPTSRRGRLERARRPCRTRPLPEQPQGLTAEGDEDRIVVVQDLREIVLLVIDHGFRTQALGPLGVGRGSLSWPRTHTDAWPVDSQKCLHRRNQHDSEPSVPLAGSPSLSASAIRSHRSEGSTPASSKVGAPALVATSSSGTAMNSAKAPIRSTVWQRLGRRRNPGSTRTTGPARTLPSTGRQTLRQKGFDIPRKLPALMP